MTLPLPLVVATGNADKVSEIIEILVARTDEPLAAWALTHGEETYGFLVDTPEALSGSVARYGSLTSAPDVEETGSTLEANARIKAAALCDATGLLAIADDTGLEVDALDGAPGVHSARYAGPHASYAENVELLLSELEGTYPTLRTARFATVALARWPDGEEVSVRGEVAGIIAAAVKGDHGFGYDPVFVPTEGDGRTFAEMTPPEKHALSHRGRAFRALAEELTETR